ncbi:MAG: flavodoxin family protein [Candidatus Latescibacteria bacterium]|jgi:multimeric flavodoxin WrbA|nr:flavodoxin family protein [Candidatus Latescibacterota bacterium]
MKVVSFLGSRNPEGRTAAATDAFLQGVINEGGQTEKVFLTEMQIERCHQCHDDGWGICRSEGQCKIEDDFAPLVDRIVNADAAVFATPVYFGDLSESMHAFLNRLRRICMHETGKEKISGKPAVGICVAGGGGGGAPVCAVSLENVLSRCGFDVVDMIPTRRQNLELKLNVLRTTGEWLSGYTPS